MVFQSTAGIPIPLPGNRQWIATVGSVGQPRDGKPLAMYALFDLAQSRLTFHRVADDHVAAATAAAVRRAGLPEYFAKRLEEGKWWRSAARLWSLLPRALLRPAGRRIEKNSGPARLDCTRTGGGRAGDLRSDIFAIAVMLYELATGELPFGCPTTDSGLRLRLWMDLKPPRALRPDLPEWLQEVILRCLEHEAVNRYPSAAHLAFDLTHPDQI